MSLLQWRVRTLLIVVALIGLGLGAILGILAERRRSYYKLRVESLAWGEADVVDRIAQCLAEAREADQQGDSARATAARDEAEYLAQLASWHVRVERTYMRAIERPWEPIPPDPPPPQPPESVRRLRDQASESVR